ncbi:MAG: hypothetical protein RLZZ426_628 [Actinomycetota bacterium]|jgi:uncharacterized membrane protein
MKSFSWIITTLARFVLAGFMLSAGVGHFRSTDSFLAQVPPFLPNPELIVYVSGVIEISLALGLVLLNKYRVQVGWALAGFYVLIFPGNISQFLTETSAFGLDTNTDRAVRLIFQPILIVWALWCTGAWNDYRSKRLLTK